MGRGTIDWKSVDSYNRLLAAMVAAQDLKPNYKKIADMYGEGATYDSIEGRFRIIRKEAEKLKAEIESGNRGPAPPRGSGSKNNSPKKPHSSQNNSFGELNGVRSGRISKNTTPTKRRSATQAKKEILECSTSTSTSGEMTNTPSSSAAVGANQGDVIVPDDEFAASFDPSIASMHFDHEALYDPGMAAHEDGTQEVQGNLDILGSYNLDTFEEAV